MEGELQIISSDDIENINRKIIRFRSNYVSIMNIHNGYDILFDDHVFTDCDIPYDMLKKIRINSYPGAIFTFDSIDVIVNIENGEMTIDIPLWTSFNITFKDYSSVIDYGFKIGL